MTTFKKLLCRCEEGDLPDDTCAVRQRGEQSPTKQEIASGKEQALPRNDIMYITTSPK